jgi:hypothetical protein
MAAKIIGKVLGIGGSKKKTEAAPTTTTPAKGPVVTTGTNLTADMRRRLAGGRALPAAAARASSGVPLVNTTGKLGA